MLETCQKFQCVENYIQFSDLIHICFKVQYAPFKCICILYVNSKHAIYYHFKFDLSQFKAIGFDSQLKMSMCTLCICFYIESSLFNCQQLRLIEGTLIVIYCSDLLK